MRLDGLSLPFALTIYILCTVLALYSKPYMAHRIEEEVREKFDNTGTDSNSHSRIDERLGRTESSQSGRLNIETLEQRTILSSKRTICKIPDWSVFRTLSDVFDGDDGDGSSHKSDRILCLLRTYACPIIFSDRVLWLRSKT